MINTSTSEVTLENVLIVREFLNMFFLKIYQGCEKERQNSEVMHRLLVIEQGYDQEQVSIT